MHNVLHCCTTSGSHGSLCSFQLTLCPCPGPCSFVLARPAPTTLAAKICPCSTLPVVITLPHFSSLLPRSPLHLCLVVPLPAEHEPNATDCAKDSPNPGSRLPSVHGPYQDETKQKQKQLQETRSRKVSGGLFFHGVYLSAVHLCSSPPSFIPSASSAKSPWWC